jgi:amino acid adenylation domain-containing protein
MSSTVTHGFRVSAQQRRLWTLSRHNDAYRVQALVRFDADVDAATVNAAIARAIARHDILRTVFVREPGFKTPIQVIADHDVSVVRTVHLGAADEALTLDEIASAELRAPIDPGHGPLHRFTIVGGAGGTRLIVTLPALCADERSLENLAHAIVAGCHPAAAVAVADAGADADADVLQYSQYTEWQHELLNEHGDGVDFWRKQRAAWALAPAGVPAESPDSADNAPFAPRHVALSLDADLTARVRDVAQRHDVGIPAVLLTCWQTLHSRTTGDEAAVCGVFSHGRKYEDLDRAIGVFAQHLPVCAHIHPTFAFDDASRAMDESLRAIANWEEYYAPDDVDGAEEADSFIPVQFEYGEARAGVEIRYACIDRFRVRLRAVVGGDAGRFEIHYDANAVTANEAENLAARYLAVVTSACHAPRTACGLLDVMGPAERRQVLRDANETAVDFELTSPCVHRLFEAQARRTPEGAAVMCDGVSLSYRELNERANALAQTLRRRRIGPDDVVGCRLERGLDMVVAILGIMKAGAAYLPIDPIQPPTRVAYMLRQARASVVVTSAHLGSDVDGCVALPIDGASKPTAKASRANPRVDVGGANLAYVIFTSGSTGEPKGVAVEHRQLSNYVASISSALALPPGSTYALVSTFSADLGHTAIFPALTSGGCLHVITEACATDAERFGDYVQAHAIDCLKIVPSHLNALLAGSRPARVLPARWLVVGGEASRWEAVDRLRALAPACRILNHYGPTETTVGSLTCELRGGDLDRSTSHTAPIGRPLANTRAYVLDASGQPVPVGVSGELYIGGVGVARGYFGRPEWTAERFVPDAWSGAAGTRLYRTGDRARWRRDGRLEFLGRRDHQVKVRGYRIELGEIEAALRQCPGVRDAVVIAGTTSRDASRTPHEDESRLRAYVVTDGRSAAEVREALGARLPGYMIPAAIVPLDRLPLSSNGKVDRAALPPDLDQPSAAAYEPPRTEIEGVLAQIWADVLRLDRVSTDADFFALGGHSLLVTQVMSRIREVLHVDVALRALFDAPTLAGQAAVAEAALRGGAGVSAPVIARVPRTGPLPLSFAQQRLWFLDRLEEGRPFYNVPGALRLTGSLDVSALARALTEVVRRHEVLRTTFESVDGTAVQIVHPPAPVDLPVTDLSMFAADAREVDTRRLVAEDASAPFDLATGPLIRPRVIRLSPNEHVLLFTRHHIVSDEWSTALLTREVAALYGAYASGRPSPLAELDIQYADYAAWQRQQLQGEELERQLAYWRQQLAGIRPLELPTDRPRSRATSFRVARHTFGLGEELSDQLRALGRRESATLFMTLLAAFQVLLGRYAGQDDVSVGTPIAGRTRRETEALMGPFVNTLLLRTDLSGAPTFLDVLRRVREVALGAHANQDVPFERLVEDTQPERDRTRAPLFQVMFTVRAAGAEAPRLPGLEVRPFAAESGAAKFDLILAFSESGRGLRGVVEYNADLFDAATIARLAEHLDVLLAQIVTDAERPIAALALTTPEARQQVLRYAGHRDEDAGGDASSARSLVAHAAPMPDEGAFVHQLFEQQAARHPEATAVVSAGRDISYQALNASANRLSHYLRGRGVGPEVCVGICLEHGSDLFVAMLAVLKAGGAYVPLDPRQPAARTAAMCESARVSCVITRGTLMPAAVECRPIDLDAEREAIAQESAANPAVAIAPGHLAYVVFTSGTTGRPKGVAIEHHALASRIASMVALKRLAPGDRVLQFTSPSADSAGEEIYPTLASGAALVTLESPSRLSAVEFLGECERLAITVVHMPGAYWHEVAAVAADRARIPPTLRQTFVGGERLRPERVHAWRTMMRPGDRFVNVYGPTEITITATTFAIGAIDAADAIDGGDAGEAIGAAGALDAAASREASMATAPFLERIPIGTPLGSTRVYLLDRKGAIQPVGVVGELHLGGEGVARGYVNAPGLTAERFVPCAFEPAGQRVYRTGDMGRYLPDGAIEFLGRGDQQMRVRGYRVEPAEIEATLLECSEVRAAATVLREDVAGDPRLVTYVVAEPGERLEIDRLRHVLERHLPGYMVPAAIVPIECLPLTVNGKLNEAALPPPIFEDRGGEIVAPRTEIEELLVHLWADVLHCDAASVHGNFFELGGHSLLATRLISRVCAAFHVDIPLRTLFEGPTVAAMARAVESAMETPRRVPSITPGPRAERPLLSFAQQRLWFLDQLEPGNPFYNSAGAIRLIGVLDGDVLGRALSEVFRRHEVLRTTFETADRQPVQVIHPPAPVVLETTSLESALDPAAEARQVAEQEAREPFDLRRGPLVRLRLLRLAPEDHVLLFTMHHIVTDGWSMGVLFREVAALYTAFAEGKPSPLPDLAMQYADYAEWQREWTSGELLDTQVAYWKRQLAGAPEACELPTDRPRPAVQEYRGARMAVAFPEQVARDVRELCRAEGATSFMVLLAAFQVLLQQYTGLDDVVVGTDIANRQYRETEELIGFFVNQLVMRTDLSGDLTFRTLVRRVREHALGAYANQDAPFDRIVEELQPVRDLSRAPLFQIKFLVQPATAAEPLTLRGLRTAPFGFARHIHRFDMTVALGESGSRIGGQVEYSTDLYDASTIERFVGHFERLLIAVMSNPDIELSQLALLDPAERVRLLQDWSTTRADSTPDLLAHEMFESHAAGAPARTAVICGRDELTYEALDRRSNQLARHLQSLGVGPEVPVGLCIGRSVSLVTGLLAILKAGGAYVPFDPEYPASRLAFMLEQSRVPVLLTEDRLAQALPVHGANVVSIDGDAAHIDRQSQAPLRAGVTPDTLAYIIYTSGSTGQPKGTMVSHGGLRNLAAAQAQVFDIRAGTRALQFASSSFDASIFEICLALCAGATLHVSDAASRMPGPDLVTLLREGRIDTVTLPPSVLAMLPEESLSGIRTVIVAGEACPPALVSRWARGRRFFNAYGPTEATVWATTAECRSGEKPTIGLPVPNVTCYVVNAQLQPVPIGVAGELLIGGAGVARGYLDRPDLTAERFIPDPFGTKPGARLYRTGDLVRWLADGRIDFLGRIDHQVKVRGYRIELAEIEAVLSEVPGVGEAVAVARDDDGRGRTIAAYVVPSRGAVLAAGDLRARVRERLPEYMMPAGIVVLDELPRLPNGKLDRRALPVPAHGEASSGVAEQEAPATAIERTIVSIWREVLNVEHIDAHQNFFDSGGHSLLMVQVHARLCEALGMELALMDLFQYPTVRTLATHLTQQADGGASPSEGGGKPTQDGRPDDGPPRKARTAHATPAGALRPRL